MKRINVLLIGIFLVAVPGFFPGCVTDTASLKIEKSLPQDKLAYYNDSFDKFRTDLWDKAGYIANPAQEANFKLAKIEVRSGKFRIETETGCFSKGGLGSKYGLRGDFDIQVDCQIDFLDDAYDMDQFLSFGLVQKGKEISKNDAAFLGLFRKERSNFSTIFSAVIEKGEYYRGNWDRIGNFDGTLRIVRLGDRINTLFKRRGGAQWKRIDTFQATPNDVMIGFKLENFTPMRTSITAGSPITATFDNFRINAAEEIIEEDI